MRSLNFLDAYLLIIAWHLIYSPISISKHHFRLVYADNFEYLTLKAAFRKKQMIFNKC